MVAENIKKLHDKFRVNLEELLMENEASLEEVEIKFKAISYFGGILFRAEGVSDTQKNITKIYDEIFTDFSIATYLSVCAIDNSAKIVLRRVLELGITTVYLWDLPHKYWSWSVYEDHNNDLNFNEMLEYLNTRGYVHYVNLENNSTQSELLKKEPIGRIYRELSNVIHGKTATFESLDEGRFCYQKEDFIKLREYILKIENILLSLWKNRFPKHFETLEQNFSSLTRYTYEY